MKPKVVAVITGSLISFGRFISGEGKNGVTYLRIDKLNDVIGKSFDSYEILHDAYKIHDVHDIIACINSRLNPRLTLWQKIKQKLDLWK